MRLIRRTLFDPLPQLSLLRGGQRLTRLRWRHHFRNIRAVDARPQSRFVQVPWHDGHIARLRRLERLLTHIQTQTGLSQFRVGTVALKTVLREDRSDVAIELHAVIGPDGCPGKKAQHDGEPLVVSRVHSRVPDVARLRESVLWSKDSRVRQPRSGFEAKHALVDSCIASPRIEFALPARRRRRHTSQTLRHPSVINHPLLSHPASIGRLEIGAAECFSGGRDCVAFTS